MSFIIWYQVEIEEEKPAGGLLGAAASLIGLGLPLKVSNSVLNGAYILDADITVTMTAGDAVFDPATTPTDTAATGVQGGTRSSTPRATRPRSASMRAT